ncbi:MAG: zinc ribbon domain-containing protein [Chloroflexi bacterium]|nr:zinc ribbon domain-containing protein [Chloroflexota bacterium]
MDILLSLFRDINFDWLAQFQWVFMLVAAILGAYFILFALSLAVWVFRDIRTRSRDPFAIAFAIILVLVLNLPGLALYLLLRPNDTLSENYERSLQEEALLRELDNQVSCPSCHRPIEPEFAMCPFCYTLLKRTCPNCRRLLSPSWRGCPYCATRLAESTVTSDQTQEVSR